MNRLIMDILIESRLNLLDGEFFSATSAKVMADRIEAAILNKFNCIKQETPILDLQTTCSYMKRKDPYFQESIEEVLAYNELE